MNSFLGNVGLFAVCLLIVLGYKKLKEYYNSDHMEDKSNKNENGLKNHKE